MDDDIQIMEMDMKEDPSQRRAIRSQYRELQNNLEQKKDDLVKPNSTGLLDTLDQANKIFTSVKKTREAVMDSQLLLRASKLATQQAQNLNATMFNFDQNIFVERLFSLMEGRRDDEAATQRLKWEKVAAIAQTCLRSAPKAEFMLGPMSMDTKKKTIVRKTGERKKFEEGNAVQPITEKEAQSLQKDESSTAIEIIAKALDAELDKRNCDEMPLFEFIVNPHSFSQTVENIFHLSFLIKENTVGIHMDKHGLPMVELLSQEEEQGKPSREKCQLVMELNLSDWKALVEAYNITKSVVPHRASKTDADAGAASGKGKAAAEPARKKANTSKS